MRVIEIANLIEGKLVTSVPANGDDIRKAFSSDLMSDVLTLDEENILLITGLANLQIIRTAEMADIQCVVLARGKKASVGMIDLANESSIHLLETPFSVFRTSGILYQHGIRGIY